MPSGVRSVLASVASIVVSYTPELSTEEKAKRKYTTLGKVKLQDAERMEVSDGDESDYNFLKVTVEMK